MEKDKKEDVTTRSHGPDRHLDLGQHKAPKARSMPNCSLAQPRSPYTSPFQKLIGQSSAITWTIKQGVFSSHDL